MCIKDRLLARKVHHFVQLTLQGLNLIDLRLLLLLETLVFKYLFSLFQQILSHFHGLFEGLVPVFHDLAESLLIHLDHLLLVFEHPASLLLLLLHPIGLTCHLLCLQLHGPVRVPKLRVLCGARLRSTISERALQTAWRRWSAKRGRSSSSKGSRATKCASSWSWG